MATKEEIIQGVVRRTDLRRSEAKSAVDATFEAIETALRQGDEVRLVGFGSFSITTAASKARLHRLRF